MKQHLFILLFSLLSWSIIAQDSLALDVVSFDKDRTFITKNIRYQTIHQTKANLQKELNGIVLQWHGKGYLEASIDSLVIKGKKHTAYLHIGEQYKWIALKNGDVEATFLSKIGFREKFFQQKIFNYKEVLKVQESLLQYAENNGYPFAYVRLDSIQIKEGQIAARLYLQKNQLFTFEGINLVDKVNISKKYLENYLGIKEGELYNESKVRDIKKRLKSLPFLQEKRTATVTFAKDKATVNLFLKKKQASRFDFIVGVLPNNEATGKLLLTGQAQIDLLNPFGTGKTLSLNWQQLRAGTQRLNADFKYPYIIGLPVGLDSHFELYKRDSTYLDLSYDLGIQYLLEGGNYIEAFWKNTSSSLLEVDESRIISTQKLPNNLDVSHATFGLEYRLERLDYRFNPRKGIDLLLRGGASLKRIQENNNIVELKDENNPNFDFSSLYDSLTLRSYQFKTDANFAIYFPMFKRGAIKAGINTGAIFSKTPLLQNEQYRIGGNQVLRGFDEESVFASLYAVTTLETRLLIGENSYLYAFGDFAYVIDNDINEKVSDFPLGFGFGLSFETRVGIFGLSYALGRQQQNPINFRTGKIHFGYVNFF